MILILRPCYREHTYTLSRWHWELRCSSLLQLEVSQMFWNLHPETETVIGASQFFQWALHTQPGFDTAILQQTLHPQPGFNTAILQRTLDSQPGSNTAIFQWALHPQPCFHKVPLDLLGFSVMMILFSVHSGYIWEITVWAADGTLLSPRGSLQIPRRSLKGFAFQPSWHDKNNPRIWKVWKGAVLKMTMWYTKPSIYHRKRKRSGLSHPQSTDSSSKESSLLGFWSGGCHRNIVKKKTKEENQVQGNKRTYILDL